MALRYYRNGPARALAVPLANGTDTSITLDSVAGFPTQFPYTLILDPDESTEEVVDATAAVGNIVTITRGVDSTTAVAHGAGAVVYHGVSARDAREANEHVNATTNVHGTTGSLVDTDSVQTIAGRKVFTDVETVGGGDVVAVGGVQTVTGAKTFSGATTFSGAETHTNSEVHSGAESHSGAVNFTGTVRHSNVAHQPSVAGSTTDDSTTSTTFVAGSPVVGTSFVAPPSGKLYFTVSVYMQQPIDGESALAGFGIREGAVVGAGAVFLAATSDRALICGDAVNTGAPARLQASRRALVTGFTPGDTYNVQVETATTAGGSCAVFYREILVEPVP